MSQIPANEGGQAAPIIYLNGFPGTGKLTIAKSLVEHLNSTASHDHGLPIAKLVHNHLLINPVDAVLDRAHPKYQETRRAVRKVIYTAIATEPSVRRTVFVLTDWQSGDSIGASVCAEVEAMAALRGSELIPIILTCSLDENIRRLTDQGRALREKLTSVELLLKFRQQQEPPPVYKFEGKATQMELDVSELSVEEATARISGHISPFLL